MPADPSVAAPAIEVRQVPAEIVRPLRLLVLRPGRPAGDVRGRGDDLDSTAHLAAYAGSDVVGVMTLFPDPSPRGDTTAQRIRWMAVSPERQRYRIGTRLLEAGLDLARQRGAVSVWANARDTALAFYLRHGFEAIGPSYIDPETGLAHTPVMRAVDARAGA